MIVPSDKRYSIELTQTTGNGSPWTVRVFKKTLFFRRRISSDWFLNGDQARRFAEQIARSLPEGSTIENLRTRKPGWVLNRPAH
jgi:hypothetical protein